MAGLRTRSGRRPIQSHSSLKSPGRSPWILSGAIICGVVALFVSEIYSRYSAAISSAERSAQSFANVLAEHTARTFEAVQTTLRAVESIRSDAKDGFYSTPEAVNQALRNLQKNSPALIAVGWTDAEGNVQAHSYPGATPRSNIADLPHFIAQRDDPSGNFFISPPFRSAATGQWISSASLRLNGPDGAFAGVASAPLDLSYFARIYRSIEMGRNASVVLMLRDGRLLTREPFVDGVIGKSFKSTGLVAERLPKSDWGAFETNSPVDGVPRILAYRAVPGLPLVILVTHTREEALVPWYDHLRSFGPLVAMLVIVILIGTSLLSRRTRQLATQAALLQATLENIHEGLIVVDRDDRVAICNRKAVELLDLPGDMMAAHPSAEDVIAYQTLQGEFDDAPDDVRPHLRPRVSGETPNTYERKRPNGIVLEIRTVPFSEGGVVRTYRDVTDHKRDEQELRQREAQYRLLADNSTDMIFELDLDFVRRYVSPACREILGYAPEELIGTKPVNMIHPEDASQVEATYRAVVGGLARASVTNRIRHRDGRWIWVEAELRLTLGADGRSTGILGAVRDVSVRKAVEAEAAAARRQAEQAAEAKSEFLATMSHELRTPLTAIIGISELLLAGSRSPAEQRRFLQMQRNAGRDLLDIINDILDLSKVEAGQVAINVAPISLAGIVDGCVNLMSRQAADSGLELSAKVDPDIPARVLGDATRLRQVLLNLLSNGVKFTEAGSVRLDVTADASLPDGIRFAVTDTGIGIDPARSARLFERFTQADSSATRRHGGTGLGLAISRRLVELMGGTLSVSSELGRGASFFFALQMPRAELLHPVAGAAAAEAPRAGYRVLLAEDNATSRELIAAMLEQAGHQVVCVGDGRQAVGVAAAGTFDVILMDVQMPELDGLSATCAIRRGLHESSLVPIVALTASAFADEADRCLAAGMDAHIAKPIDWDMLFSTIDRLVCPPDLGSTEGLRTVGAVAPSSGFAVLDVVRLDAFRSKIGGPNTAKLLALFETEIRDRFESPPAGPNSYPAFAAELHALAGSAGLLGFDELAECCRVLEGAALRCESLATELDRFREARDRALTQLALMADDGDLTDARQHQYAVTRRGAKRA
jgi:PAS domain S-box-containing protein